MYNISLWQRFGGLSFFFFGALSSDNETKPGAENEISTVVDPKYGPYYLINSTAIFFIFISTSQNVNFPIQNFMAHFNRF